MPYNKNAGYGLEQVNTITASAMSKVGLSFGRTLYVFKNADPFFTDRELAPTFDRLQQLFPVDPDGNARVFNTITAAVAAAKDYDTILIGPGYWEEASTLTLSGLHGVKLIGTGNAMQWGEGQTCIGDETSGLDLLNITGCFAIEISNIMFYNATVAKDAINFTGLNYSIHIHDCNFCGDVGGGAVMVYGINAADNSADLYIHDCKFFRVKTAAITNLGQRAVIERNLFIVPVDGIGISAINRSTAYNIIRDNDFLGENNGDTGISVASGTAGNYVIARNYFMNCATNMTGGGAGADLNSIMNYVSNATGGALIDPT